jgi:hypothetical protein
MIYMVEHGFADSAHEAEWNTWYSHHATYAFRSVPGWRSGQRFVAVPPSMPKYRAMYTLGSAEVLNSAEYKATTGGRFPEAWRSMITEFHRNLADGDWMPAVAEDQSLVIIDDPSVARDVPEAALQWWRVVGLDRSIAQRAIGLVDRSTGESIARRAIPGVGVYAPVFDRWTI